MKSGHKLVIKSLHDAQAECSCGKWSLSCTGARTKKEIEKEFRTHRGLYFKLTI